MKETIEEYWNWRSATYHSELEANRDEEQLVWKNILSKALPHGRIMNVLDVGTGPGHMALAFSEMKYNVTAVDISFEMLKKAKKNAQKRGFSIEFYHGDAESLPFRDGEFDLIFSKYLLWTLPSPDAFFRECQRLLSPTGIILTIDGLWFRPSLSNSIRKATNRCLDSLYRRQVTEIFEQYYSDIKAKLPLYHENTPDNVSALLEKHGFHDIYYQYLSEYADFQKRHDKFNYYTTQPTIPYMVIGKKR